MAKKIKAAAPVVPPAAHDANESNVAALVGRVSELEGDLSRIVELLIKGDLDSAKFKEILAKRQGPSKA